jgi:hypothetical protein
MKSDNNIIFKERHNLIQYKNDNSTKCMFKWTLKDFDHWAVFNCPLRSSVLNIWNLSTLGFCAWTCPLINRPLWATRYQHVAMF